MIPDQFRSEREKHRYFSALSETEKISALNEIVRKSEYTVFLGGAGVSTESGIPDFRSKDGLYRKKDSRFERFRPEYLLSHECLKKHPEVFFAYARENLDARGVKPNAAHFKLAEMEKAGKLNGLVTQNIDGLHQKAGSREVQEIHGTMMRGHCVSCRKAYSGDFIFDYKSNQGNQGGQGIPICTECGAMVRPDVVLYGELLAQPDYENALNMINLADCLIIGGTSLEVGSAAQLAHLFHGRYLVIINKGKTRMEGKADLVFHDSIGKIMSQIQL